MRKLIAVALLASFALPANTLAFGGPEGQDPAKRLETMAQRLDLSAEQKTQVQNLFESHRQKMMALRDETQAQLADILTEEQLEKLNNMHEKRRDMMRERMGERQP